MKFRATIDLHSYWHAGSGEAGPGDLDAVVTRDALGLPCLGGKGVKGLFRDAALLIVRAQPDQLSPEQHLALFGPSLPPGRNRPREDDITEGLLKFESARMPRAFRDWVAGLSRPERSVIAGLFETIASAAIEKGVAKAHSLRKIEVAIPMDLLSEIELSGEPPEGVDIEKVLKTSASLIRRLGSHRHRGLGRCRVQIGTVTAEAAS